MKRLLTPLVFALMMIVSFSCTDSAKTVSSESENQSSTSQDNGDILNNDNENVKTEIETESDTSKTVEGQIEPITPTNATSQTSHPEKRALIIGLGKQEDPKWDKINGDKDVPLVEKMLTNAGYKDIQTLKNEEATKNNIIGAFDKLAAKCNVGDVVYIHFSGHGQQVLDQNGDEKDRLDESWIPYDAFRYIGKNYDGSKHLIDDEVNRCLLKIKHKVGTEGKILVVVDACHSGGSDRGVNKKEVIRGVSDTLKIPPKATKPKPSPKYEREWLLLSACMPSQSNAEIVAENGMHYGKLTYALYTMDLSSPLNNEEFENSIKVFMQKHNNIDQRPSLADDKVKYNIWDFFN